MNINLRDMSAEAMIGVSAEWVDPNWELWPRVEADDILEPIFRRVKAVHGELVSTNETRSPQQERIAQLTAKMTELDLYHDRKSRGIFNSLQAAVDLANSPGEAEALSELLETLFPVGLSVSQLTYAEQAGMAKRVKDRLSPVVRTQLGSLVFGRRNALAEVDDWLAAALQIAQYQAERARLGYVPGTGVVTKGDLRDIRLNWIQSVNAMLTVLQFSALSEEEKNMVVANLREVSAAAVRKRNSQRKSAPAKEGSSVELSTDAEASDAY